MKKLEVTSYEVNVLLEKRVENEKKVEYSIFFKNAGFAGYAGWCRPAKNEDIERVIKNLNKLI